MVCKIDTERSEAGLGWRPKEDYKLYVGLHRYKILLSLMVFLGFPLNISSILYRILSIYFSSQINRKK